MKLFRISSKLLLASALASNISFAADLNGAHGISMHGDLKYPAGFEHYEYVNPEAPKGGTVRQWAMGSFDSFNPFIIKGSPAAGSGSMYDSLMSQSLDEPFSQYGLLAEKIDMPEDRSSITFYLREEATFSDGHPVTADDVIFTFDILRSKGNPFYANYYADIEKIEAIDNKTVKFSFKKTGNREIPLIVGQAQILPKHFWQGKEFDKPSREIPLGSGPYTIDTFEAGRSVTLRYRDDYWGKDLAVNRGKNNFATIRYDYYRDSTVALEAFKAGEYDFRQETSSKNWATAYTGQAIDDGRIKKEEIQHQNSSGMQAFVMNTRRDKFADSRVRQALGYAFDFEWTNKNIFFSAYSRTHSYFSNSEMSATALPNSKELQILEPIRDKVPPEVFNKIYQAPGTDGSGNVRTQLRKGLRLLKEAGWTFKKGKLTDANGKAFTFEILLIQKEFERVVSPFIRNLKKMGIEVSIRIIDVPQYINRMRDFDFDMVVGSWGQSSSPGNEQRNYWHSGSAAVPGSRNWIGIQDEAVDHLVEQLIVAPDREQLVLRARALDRVLQWNHFVIPQYHISAYRIAYWDKFGRPEKAPKYALGFNTWWVKPESQQAASN